MQIIRTLALCLFCIVSNSLVAGERVTIFSQTYCPACLHAKMFFSHHEISYTEVLIDKSQAAMTYFKRLGGRGTPFIIINNQPLQGFHEDLFWQAYADKPKRQGSSVSP